MSDLGKVLIPLALVLGVAGSMTSATWLLIIAVVLIAIFIGAWVMSELRPDDPWRKYRKRASDDS